MNKQTLFSFLACTLLLSGLTLPASANDIISVKNVGMELARDIATDAIKACREMGYQVSAVVVDRNGLTRAALRDDLASRFTLQIAREKANAAILGGAASSEVRNNRKEIKDELNNIDDIIILEGGLLITTGGYRIGAIGVSGAPGGDIDEKCSQKALDNIEDRLEFATE